MAPTVLVLQTKNLGLTPIFPELPCPSLLLTMTAQEHQTPHQTPHANRKEWVQKRMRGMQPNELWVVVRNPKIHKYLKTHFTQIPNKTASEVAYKLLTGELPIKCSSKRLIERNLTKFNTNKEIENDALYALEPGFYEIIHDILKGNDDEKYIFVSKQNASKHIIKDEASLSDAIAYICTELHNGEFSFSFNNTKLLITTPRNTDELQRCSVYILSDPIAFDYPLQYHYLCPNCGATHTKFAYETESSNGRIKCSGRIITETDDGKIRSRVCATTLAPSRLQSYVRTAYFYQVIYKDESTGAFSQPALAISFENVKPGYYETALFRVGNPGKREYFLLMAFKPSKKEVLELPERTTNNYVFTLINYIDEYIEQKANYALYGLLPIKAAMILQAVAQHALKKRKYNIKIVGDASTGKTSVFRYYGILLNGYNHMSTNGLSVSIPALRGTRIKLDVMGKEESVISVGHLGTYYSIHIDEAGENKELVQQLKTFLLEPNYSYQKAGGTNEQHVKIAQVNVSENVNLDHLGQYRGEIRKKYNELVSYIKGEEKEDWDEKWDLHLPIEQYTNNYLKEVIMQVRYRLASQNRFWLDGDELALHQRFPYYFYLVSAMESQGMLNAVNKNVSRKVIEDNQVLLNVFASEAFIQFFSSIGSQDDVTITPSHIKEVCSISEKYGTVPNQRQKEFLVDILVSSVLLNKRKSPVEQDFLFVEWLVSHMNRIVDVALMGSEEVLNTSSASNELSVNESLVLDAKPFDFGGEKSD